MVKVNHTFENLKIKKKKNESNSVIVFVFVFLTQAKVKNRKACKWKFKNTGGNKSGGKIIIYEKFQGWR